MWDHVHWVLFCSDYILSATRNSQQRFLEHLQLYIVSDNQFHLCNPADRLL